MSQRSPQVHPFTFFIVGVIQTVYNDLSEGATNIREATRDLYWLLTSLDRKGQESLKEEIQQIEKVMDGKEVIDRVIFRALYKKAMIELHDEGYFIAAKMRPPTRESSMKDFGLTIATAQAKAKKQ